LNAAFDFDAPVARRRQRPGECPKEECRYGDEEHGVERANDGDGDECSDKRDGREYTLGVATRPHAQIAKRAPEQAGHHDDEQHESYGTAFREERDPIAARPWVRRDTVVW